MTTLAVYVHWPWCKAKCPYCDFNSHVLRDGSMLGAVGERYIAALEKEILHWAGRGVPKKVASVFFGGGTPSLMQPNWVAKILNSLDRAFDMAPDCEITVECNPTSSSLGLFRDLKQAGINRVSIGVQGLQPELLAFLGREHDVYDALKTLENALGTFDNVNADVIYGAPAQNLRLWQEDLRAIAGMGTSHLSAYQLTIEANTAFYGQVARGAWKPLENDAQADFFDVTREVLEGAGYVNYEVSNFCRPSMACRHNCHVWRYLPYIGIGAGAHGRIFTPDKGWVATLNRRMPDTYMDDMERGFVWAERETPVNPTLALQEALMMGLRLAEGVNLPALKKRFQASSWAEAVRDDRIAYFCSKGLLAIDTDTTLCATEIGWHHLDSLLRDILRD